MKKITLTLGVLFIIFGLLYNSCKKENDDKNTPNITYYEFTDTRDGQTYKYVQIGDQYWMAENLNYESDSGSYVYNNELSNAAIYGRLYDWETAINVCPDGWQLPSDSEWKELEMYLGMSQSDVNSTGLRGTNEGSKLKSTSGWNYDGNGTNESGFSALPGGYRNYIGDFVTIGGTAYFWSSTASYSNASWYRLLGSNAESVYRSSHNQVYCFSVRCVKDE